MLCYRNGALGHTVSALLNCCTHEGGLEKFPLFNKGKNLHHFKPGNNFYTVKHPEINISTERELGNFVISSSSRSEFGKLLILFMSYGKWYKHYPDFNAPINFNQGTGTYGEQIEILGRTVADVIKSDKDWFLEVDYVFDIMHFWNNTQGVVEFLKICNLTPELQAVEDFCNQVKISNETYFNSVKKCYVVAECVLKDVDQLVDLTFFEVAVCYALLLINYKHIRQPKVPQEIPKSTVDFKKLFEE